VGRHRVERWGWTPSGRVLHDKVTLSFEEQPTAQLLQVAMRKLLGQDARHPDHYCADIVLESAWLPVIPLPANGELWSRRKLNSLAQHHLLELHGSAEGGDWLVALDHLAGSQSAIAFALAPAVRAALLQAMSDAKCRPRSLQPTLPWGFHQFKAQNSSSPWWVWVEQDRSMVGHVQRQKIALLNAGAPVPRDLCHAARLIVVEGARHGHAVSDSRGIVAGWTPLSPGNDADGAASVECDSAGRASSVVVQSTALPCAPARED
jgi:hypothetical protein